MKKRMRKKQKERENDKEESCTYTNAIERASRKEATRVFSSELLTVAFLLTGTSILLSPILLFLINVLVFYVEIHEKGEELSQF